MTRAEAIEWLEYHIAITDYDKDDDLLKALRYAVRKLKTEPVKHGRWIRSADGHSCLCSVCGTPYRWSEADTMRYCKMCGADMRGGENE